MNFISRMLDNWARRRFARSISAIWATRHDNMSVAMHLRDALPVYGDDEFWGGHIGAVQPLHPCSWQHGDLQPHDVLQHAAAQAGVLSFTISHASSGPVAQVYVISPLATSTPPMLPDHTARCGGYNPAIPPPPGHDQTNIAALAAAVERLRACASSDESAVTTSGHSVTQPSAILTAKQEQSGE